ncbi:glycosyltransferase [Shewanella khirikhana]|uniref:CgeB family protein n=1 Tax=Shewanella khirikhana TaxID=1965282 RepID=UPI0030CAE593
MIKKMHQFQVGSKARKPKIGLVADLATAVGLAPDASLIHLTPGNWKLKINLFRPDFVLIESAWRGHGNSWQRQIVDAPSVQLTELADYCRKRDLPAVFWNKEDPIHFERFMQTALLFDYVLTTDSDSVPAYLALKGACFKTVDTLAFCAQPKWHFPAATDAQADDSVAFLGGYYGLELAERSEQQLQILSALSDKGLKIYDRFWFEHKNQGSFPEALKPFCLPAVDLSKSYALYRRYKTHINFNTVQHSQSMLSRRVFELAASKAAIISTPSIAMGNIFGSHIPQVIDGITANRALQEYRCDPEKRAQDVFANYEVVMDAHTWKHRLNKIQQLLCLK